MIVLLETFGICLIFGALLDRGLFGAPGRGVFEWLGRSLALGLGGMGVLCLLLDGVGIGISPFSVFITAGLIGAGLCWRAFVKERTPPDTERFAPNVKILVLCCALMLFAGAALWLVVWSGWVRPTYQFDAITRWIFKAKAIGVDGSVMGAVSSDPIFHFTHQRYPPLVSYVANLPLLISGEFNDRIASAVFPFYTVALVLVVFGVLRRRCGGLAAAIGAAWVASLPLIAYQDGPPPTEVPPGAGGFSAMADIPLSLFATCAVLAALDGLEGKRARAYFEAGFFLTLATLTKNEGLPMLAGMGLGLVICVPKARWKVAGAVVLGAFGCYGLLWARHALTFPALDENYLAQLNLQAVTEGLGRSMEILGRMFIEPFVIASWNFVWVGVIALLIVSGKKAVDRSGRMLLIFCVFQVGAYAFAFLITAWESPVLNMMGQQEKNLMNLMNLTMGRLFIHITPLMVVAALRGAPLLRPGKRRA